MQLAKINYKKFLKSKDFRIKLLSMLDWVSDSSMIKLQYRIKTGRKLNLNSPQRYSEKIQWYKLYYRDPLMTQCSDKWKVREFVSNSGCADILIENYGSWTNANDIDFDALPDSFILKTTNGSHTNIIVDDKKEIDVTKVREKLNGWLKEYSSKLGREWAYYGIEPRIIAEQLLHEGNEGLTDYKFFCFSGEVVCSYVATARKTKSGKQGKLNFFDKEFNVLPVIRDDHDVFEPIPKKPKNYEKMLEIAENLSKKFPHVRVDLYNIEGNIYFGELTFYTGSGYIPFNPDTFDKDLGKKFTLPEKLVTK